jgi:PAS domain S-box-containing protein
VFWITDTRKQQMLYISPAYETIWGRSCEGLYAAPQSWMDAIHEEDRERVRLAALEQGSGRYHEEYRIVRPDGALRWIRDRAFPVFDASGDVYRVVGVAEDTTERKAAEQRLQEQASLLNRARDAILVRDLEHHITYWNQGAERLYGWTAEEVAGRKISELLYRDTAAFTEGTAAVLKNGEWHGEIQQYNKKGGLLLVEARWTLVCDAAGRPQSILAINTDITEKKKLEQQFLRAQRLESIGTLAGGIAHDLNNVLAPILMSVELLRLTSQDERMKSILATIETSAQRGADMVRQILSFARGADGRRVPVDPRHILRDIQHLLRETFPKNIELRHDVAPNLCTITGDHTQIHQVLLNLCVNSRDSMPSGGTLTLSASNLAVDALMASMHPHAKPGPHVLIRVSDTGSGIPPEVMDKIFDPFFTTKEVGKGTGLGLSTVLAIVRSHGGFLEVESESSGSGGTTFSIYLPSQAPAVDGEAGGLHHALPQGNGELILVVDDESAVRTITRQTLEAFGYRAIVAADGTEALSLYTQHQAEVAAVITDLMMPVMDGTVTIQVMRRMNPEVKIIAGSGIATDGTAARLASLGVKQFLPKPYTAQKVLTALHELLGTA